MPKTVKHAWTHRPRSEGGTDPIEFPASSDLVWAKALAAATSISPSSGDYEFTWTNLYSNDASVFSVVDVTAGRGDWIQINEPGYYVMKCRAGGGGDWDNTYYTKITAMFEQASSPSDLVPNLGVPDYGGDQFNPASELKAGETAHPILHHQVAFHWNPASPVSDLDAEDPLKISMRVETVGATAAVLLQAEMWFMRIAATPGYSDLSP